SVCCFFFQAEDGIRDLIVTGVQTCALPIYRFSFIPASLSAAPLDAALGAGETEAIQLALEQKAEWILLDDSDARSVAGAHGLNRSEERRVGKECRSGGWRDQ